DTGCVEGSWATDDHGDMIPSGRINVQRGARFNDSTKERYIEHYGKTEKDNIYTFRGMLDNPWWHGYQKTNYVAAYIYETQLANRMQYGGTVSVPRGLSGKVKKEIDEDLAVLKKYWSKELASGKVTKQAKRDFVWGMAIHTLTDTFAHSAYVWGKRIRSGSIWCINRRMPIRKGRITPLPIRQKHIRSDGRMPEGQSMERCVSTKRQSIRRGRTMSFGMSRILIHTGWEISMRM
ncbi:MAG: hypothetical protein J6C32_07945, partial [Eubacterium sp.]|nr:hypothetical protein [Eubacterium sp.]